MGSKRLKQYTVYSCMLSGIIIYTTILITIGLMYVYTCMSLQFLHNLFGLQVPNVDHVIL